MRQSLDVSCRLLSQIRLDDCLAVFVMLIVGDCTEPVFLNVYGVQESIPRNEFRQPM